MTLVDWLFDMLGFPVTTHSSFIWYLIGGIVLLIMLDGILTFLLGAISSLTTRGR